MGRFESYPGGKTIECGNGLGMGQRGQSQMSFSLEGMVMTVTKAGNLERGLDWKVEREDQEFNVAFVYHHLNYLYGNQKLFKERILYRVRFYVYHISESSDLLFFLYNTLDLLHIFFSQAVLLAFSTDNIYNNFKSHFKGSYV